MHSGVQRLMDRHYPVDAGGDRPADGTTPLYEWMLGAVSPEAIVESNLRHTMSGVTRVR